SSSCDFRLDLAVASRACSKTIIGIGEPDAERRNVNDCAVDEVLRRRSGNMCFEGRGVVDCVAWGDYAGPTEGVGTPFNAPDPAELSSSILRKQPGPVDDSNQDFLVGDPWPINIWGETGFTPLIDCGDGHTDPAEECDDARNNSDTTPNACRSDCALPACGDRVIDADEQCDAGSSNSDSAPGACRADCALPSCGDAVIDSGEQCDDGYTDADYGVARECATGCVLAAHCGDGIENGPEDCDDGNGSNSDACLDSCTLATCGDGFVHAGIENCDDGNTSAGDGCAGDCTQETTDEPVGNDGGGCQVVASAGGAWWVGLAIAVARRRNKRRATARVLAVKEQDVELIVNINGLSGSRARQHNI
ncbi:MAG: DUF4215 domain-containing protein, partial [Polyangiales bacterium]